MMIAKFGSLFKNYITSRNVRKRFLKVVQLLRDYNFYFFMIEKIKQCHTRYITYPKNYKLSHFPLKLQIPHLRPLYNTSRCGALSITKTRDTKHVASHILSSALYTEQKARELRLLHSGRGLWMRLRARLSFLRRRSVCGMANGRAAATDECKIGTSAVRI